MNTRYGFTTRTPAMQARLASVVGGQGVFDFGCGKGELAHWMASNGAASVPAIDKEWLVRARSKKVRPVKDYLDQVTLPDRIAVGVTAWPVTHNTPGLVPALRRCDVVVYIGCNDRTWGTACGTRDLFGYLVTRELLDHIPFPQNSMVVVGKPLPEGRTREPCEAEAAGLSVDVWW